jgi:hypothetical protein
MPFVQGYLRVRSGAHPDHELPPGEVPVDPGWGVELPIGPDQGLPAPPPGIWPPPSPSHPIIIAPPGTPPGVIWPPIGTPPVWPSHPISGVGEPSHPIQPPSPGTPTHPIAPAPGFPSHPIEGVYWCIVWIPGVGYRYTTIAPGLQPEHPIVTPPPYPDQGLPPGSPGAPAHPIAPPSGPAPTPHRG